MSDSVRESIYEAIASIRLIDPHTHINPHAAASSTLADLLGYHYYTELAHSAGMPKDEIEQAGVAPRELVRRLVENLSPIENTAQYRWLVEICRMFFGFDGDRIDASNWEEVFDSAQQQMGLAEWPQMVLDQSNVEAVFLTNDFDDELTGFDTDTYIPCLRTDDLVFHLAKLETRQRLAGCSGLELDGSLTSLRESLKQRFEHFVGRGARACAISLPPSFEPIRVSDGRATTALNEVLRRGPQADPSHQSALSRRVFWTLAELCDEFGLPLDLMIGVNRGVYANGVFQGQDLYDSRVSLIQYRELFNSFPTVKFPISVLASVTNQELVSYAWIFPNVITNGHWWYSNTPSFIARDAAARLEAVPQTKQIAYYSDAYKLEFIWPKFDMYRRVLAGILADHFVKECRWTEERAIELGRQVLRDNVDEIFPRPALSAVTPPSEATTPLVDPLGETWDDIGSISHDDEGAPAVEQPGWGNSALAGTSAALAAGAIGMVEVDESAKPQAENEPAAGAEPGFVDADSSGGQQGAEEFATVVDDASSEALQPDEDEPVAETWQAADDAGLAMELDPLPSDEEIQAVNIDDVQLTDVSAQQSANDPELIEAEAEGEPLDVGDLSGDEQADESPGEEIRMLRGEASFEPDEDSLRLQPDPMTGELTFPVASEQPSQEESGSETASEWSDDDLILDAVEDATEKADAEPTFSAIDDDASDAGEIEIDLDEMAPESDEQNDYLNP